MIEKTLIDYLSAKLSVPVYAIRPDDAPTSFVVLDRTGGTKNDRVNRATVAFQSYGATLYETIQLDQSVIDAVEQIVELPQIGGVRLLTDSNNPDLVRKVPRYQCVFDITYY